MQWKQTDPGEFSDLDFPQDNSVYTFMLKKIYLESLNHQGLLVTVYLETMGTSSHILILGQLAYQIFLSFLYSIMIYMKYENTPKLLQYVLGSDFNTEVKP